MRTTAFLLMTLVTTAESAQQDVLVELFSCRDTDGRDGCEPAT